MEARNDPRSPLLLAAAAVLVVALVASGLNAFELPTWLLEVLPVLIALPLLWATHPRFPLTTLVYVCIFVHALVLILGGTYTYARVPLGHWIQELWQLQRNPYDKIGHLMQGFAPALITREILVRGAYVNGRRMTAFLALCVVMAISSCYELIEWAVALIAGQGAEDFLGTQGDPWDTQSDMFCALIGGSLALLFFSRLQERQIARTPPWPGER